MQQKWHVHRSVCCCASSTSWSAWLHHPPEVGESVVLRIAQRPAQQLLTQIRPRDKGRHLHLTDKLPWCLCVNELELTGLP